MKTKLEPSCLKELKRIYSDFSMTDKDELMELKSFLYMQNVDNILYESCVPAYGFLLRVL